MKYTIQNIIDNAEDLNKFVDSGMFTINSIEGENYVVGVKWGYTKALTDRGYKRQVIIEYLNLLEWGINEGLVCPECLKVGVFSTDEVNAFNSKCLEHGSLI